MKKTILFYYCKYPSIYIFEGHNNGEGMLSLFDEMEIFDLLSSRFVSSCYRIGKERLVFRNGMFLMKTAKSSRFR